jgi:hypothetical protein
LQKNYFQGKLQFSYFLIIFSPNNTVEVFSEIFDLLVTSLITNNPIIIEKVIDVWMEIYKLPDTPSFLLRDDIFSLLLDTASNSKSFLTRVCACHGILRCAQPSKSIDGNITCPLISKVDSFLLILPKLLNDEIEIQSPISKAVVLVFFFFFGVYFLFSWY